MITRRYLRIKVFQELFSYFLNENQNLVEAEQKVIDNTQKIYDLFIYQLSFFTELKKFEINRQYEAKKKHYPTQEDLHPNTTFVDNEIISQIENNADYQKRKKKIKVNWFDQQTLIRKTMNEIKDSELYQKYITTPSSYDEDKKFLLKVISDFLSSNDLLISYLEEKNMNWANDYDAGLVLLEKTIKQFNPWDDENTLLPGLFGDIQDNSGRYLDEVFLARLFRTVVVKSDEYDQMIQKYIKNWDFDRIAIIDTIIIKMAMAEFTQFDSIPIKVSLNEYIELSKLFSTPKSNIFVNGMLDKILSELTEENKINKTGRGLINE